MHAAIKKTCNKWYCVTLSLFYNAKHWTCM